MNACRTLTDACRTAPVALTTAVGGHVHETRGWVGAAGSEQSGIEEPGTWWECSGESLRPGYSDEWRKYSNE